MCVTWVLTVVSPMKSSLADLGVGEAPRDQAEDVELALGELGELRRRRRPRDARELRDHAPGDRRREQRVAAGDRADRGDQLLGRVVLEHEAAGARRCSAS